MTAFPWKLYKGATELVFPRGARRYVQFDVRQIQSDGAVELDWNANAVWTGDAAFRLHAVSMSCSDTTVAPISDLWQGDLVTLHAPFEFAVPGPAATLKYDPVPGSVYGVDADDNPVGSTASGSRTVSIPGAVAIRFRPIMECRIVSRSGPGGSQGRADAGWSIELIEQAGDVVEELDNETLTFAAPGLQTFAVGEPEVLNLSAFVTTTTGLPVFYAVASGTLPPGLALNGATGQLSGNPTTPGLYVVTVMAASGPLSAVQTIPYFCAVPAVAFSPVAAQTHDPGSVFSLNLAGSVSVSGVAATPTFSIVSGSLPTGLSLSSAGVISGTPTAYGAFSAVVRASIPGGYFDEQRVAFNAVAPTILSNGLALQDFTVGSAFSLDLATLVTVTGTSAAPTFTADVGSLPAGLSMSSAGVISGTPTGYGAYAFTARATLPSGQWTEVSVALFQLSPDNLPEAVILGGTPQTWTEISGSTSVVYDACDFTASGTLTVIEAGWAEFILAGGGGGGASVSSTAGGGGGGAGRFRRERVYLTAGTYTVNIGAGGAAGADGSPTSFFNAGSVIFRSAAGGARGGSTSAAGASSSTASGGGGGGSTTAAGSGGVASNSSFGSSGAPGNTSTTASLQYGGGGGGFSTVGHSGYGAARPQGGGGIKVVLWAVLDFCGGGGGGGGNGQAERGSGFNGAGSGGASNANGGAATANTGSGGGGAGGGPSGSRTGGAGGSGRAIFIVRRRTA